MNKLQKESRVNLDANVGPVTIIQVYTLDSSYDDNKIENFNKKSILDQQSPLFSLLEKSMPELAMTLLN